MTILWIKKFLDLETASGIILLVAALLGLLLENSPWHQTFVALYSMKLFSGHGHLSTTPQEIINDGLMSLFFLLISLEIKRELLIGELNSREKAILPLIAALGGMLIPAIIYVGINFNHPPYLSGWAIPTATDIAFSLAILKLLGSRIPTGLKIFLLTLALIDDLGAIIIIALFYTHHVELEWLLPAGICFLILLLLNYSNIHKFLPYAIIGMALWFCFAYSGIHPTLAGVILALTIPLTPSQNSSLLKSVEQKLHPWVAYGILPLFALVNAGFPFSAFTSKQLFNPLSIGIILGLFLGKQIGIFGASWLSNQLGIARLPSHIKWRQLYGVAIICGIGFTMSLYINTLAFSPKETQFHIIVNYAVLLGSLLSSIVGYLVLRYSLR